MRYSITRWIGVSLLIFASTQVIATDLAPNPELNIQGVGLKYVAGGTGLDARSGVITVDIGGPVVRAILYWAGRDRPCPTDGSGACVVSGADDELLFAGVPVAADRIVGTEVNDGDINNIGFAADVTSIVSAAGTGPQVFMIEDADIEDLFRLNGAGLLVVYTDALDQNLYRLIVYEGLDVAYANAPEPEAQVTTPVIFMFEAEDTPRTAMVAIFAGDAEAGRPDRIDLDGQSVLNQLDGDEGSSFDVDSFPIPIAESATEATLQLFSETNPLLMTTPDSILWELGALLLPIPAEEGATGRMTGGRNIRIGEAAIGGVHGGMTIHCDITLSNNIQVSWGRGQNGNRWHLDKPITKAICIDDPAIDPLPPAAPFDTFVGEGVGRLNNVDGSAIRFTFIDAGEPGTNDYAQISIWAPGDDPEVDTPYFSAAGFLEGGNIQAHFDQPHRNR